MGNWKLYRGEYEKCHYDIITNDDILYGMCWPNAGIFYPYNSESDGINETEVFWIRKSDKHPMDEEV